MWEFTPNASWITTIAPRGSSGTTSYRALGQTGVSTVIVSARMTAEATAGSRCHTQPMTAALTTDLDRARADLAEHGYCLLEGALEPERCRALRDRLDELATQEIADGTDYVYENGANQPG